MYMLHVTGAKRGKSRASKSRLVLVLHRVAQNVVKQTQNAQNHFQRAQVSKVLGFALKRSVVGK